MIAKSNTLILTKGFQFIMTCHKVGMKKIKKLKNAKSFQIERKEVS